MRLTDQEYAQMMLNRGKQVQAPAAKPSKYHNVLTECDGIKFQSKKEAAYYRALLCRIKAGEVKYFHRQVIFDLIGGVTYRCDYMEIWTNGEIHYVDPKGHRNQTFINKKKQVEASYPVKIEEV